MGEKCGHIVQPLRKVIVQRGGKLKIRFKIEGFQKNEMNKEEVLCTHKKRDRSDICMKESSYFYLSYMT